MLDLQRQDADGWAPFLYALWGIMFEDPCPPEGVHFLGGDIRGFCGGGMVVEVQGLWVGCPGGVMSISEGSDDIVWGSSGLKKWECMPEGASCRSPSLVGVNQVLCHVWVEDQLLVRGLPGSKEG